MPDVTFDVQDTAPAPTNPIEFTVRIRNVAFALEGDSVTAPADPLPPVVTVVSPAGSVVDAQGAIVVDVTDNVALRRAMLVVRLDALGLEEVVHNGDRFSAQYSGSSTRAPISGGFRYTIRRNGGWRSAPILDVFAIDTSGGEA